MCLHLQRLGDHQFLCDSVLVAATHCRDRVVLHYQCRPRWSQPRIHLVVVDVDDIRVGNYTLALLDVPL
jgi:hypothetical protein